MQGEKSEKERGQRPPREAERLMGSNQGAVVGGDPCRAQGRVVI